MRNDEILAPGTFISEPLGLICDPEVTDAAVRVFAVLLGFNLKGDCRPSLDTIARISNKSRSTVAASIALLEKTKWLKIHNGGGRSKCNRYELLNKQSESWTVLASNSPIDRNKQSDSPSLNSPIPGPEVINRSNKESTGGSSDKQPSLSLPPPESFFLVWKRTYKKALQTDYPCRTDGKPTNRKDREALNDLERTYPPEYSEYVGLLVSVFFEMRTDASRSGQMIRRDTRSLAWFYNDLTDIVRHCGPVRTNAERAQIQQSKASRKPYQADSSCKPEPQPDRKEAPKPISKPIMTGMKAPEPAPAITHEEYRKQIGTELTDAQVGMAVARINRGRCNTNEGAFRYLDPGSNYD